MSLTAYLLLTVFLMSAEWFYIRLARTYGWFDKPNERSSHENTTIVLAGGVIIYLAVMGTCWLGKFDLPLFGMGLTVIALISIWDDFVAVPKRYRLAVQGLAIGFLLIQERLVPGQWCVVAGLLMLGVGLVNAYNFMDGINGMTALYSLVTVVTFWFWEAQAYPGVDLIWPRVFIALLIFGYVNVRRQAICFAGDVGSISLGFIVLYGLLGAVLRSHSCLPLLCLSVYGVDTIGTIIYRLYHRQPVFLPHRLHLFQQLVHALGWSHLQVSALYALVQACLNVGVIVVMALNWSPVSQLYLAVLVISGLVAVYVWIRRRISRSTRA
jgi:UDP-GlcNAc:undecaprenyl-phosphate GlcNAc-1-phosphate transferase